MRQLQESLAFHNDQNCTYERELRQLIDKHTNMLDTCHDHTAHSTYPYARRDLDELYNVFNFLLEEFTDVSVREYRTPMRPVSTFMSPQAVIGLLLGNPSTSSDPFLISQYERFVQDFEERERFVAVLKVFSNEQGTVEIRVERQAKDDGLLF